MKKIFSFMLIAAGLLVSAQSKAENTVSLTIGETVTEYATLEQAVAAAETAGEGIIKLLPAYNRYPQAWLTDCTIDIPTGYEENDKGFFTFHAFNPDNGDEATYLKKKNGQSLLQDETNRVKVIYGEINPSLDATGIDAAMADIKKLNGFAKWGADFEVYFDANMAEGDYLIAGNYADWGWLSSYNEHDFTFEATAYQRIRLMKSAMPTNTLRYYELMTDVFNFHCGIVSKNPNANAGKTFWCELYLYKPGNENIKILINRTPYTFPMKPIVTTNEVVETPENKEILDELKAENEGVKAMTDSMTNIYPATSAYESDKQKTIIVILTDVKVEIIPGAYESSLEAITYNVTPKYIDASGNMQTIPNDYITEPITFRLPISSEFADKSVNVWHKANDAAAEDYVGQFPVKELNGSYYIELSASEFSKYIIKVAKNYYERTTTNGMIGTICVPYDIVADSLTNAGATFYEINYRNNTTTTQVTEVEGVEVDSLEGGKAYVFHATGTLIHVGWKEGSTAKDVVTTGSMVGNLSGAKIKPASFYAQGDVEPYIVTSEGIFRPCGPQATVPMNRAYLNMAKVPTTKDSSAPGRRIRLTANGAQVVTGMENVNANANVNRKMIMNGKFVIVKDGKQFNAIGQEL